MESISTLLGSHAPESTALRSPGRDPSSYSQLQEQLAYTRDWLNDRGIGRNDTVAIVLPNGADMASAFLAVSASAISAPLNPAYRAQEYEFYLSDLSASLLMVAADSADFDETTN